VTIAIDTGPLVALLNSRDQFHGWARDTWSELVPPLVTCEAVLTEASYLVRNSPGGQRAVLELIERGAIRVSFRLEHEAAAVRTLVTRFASVPMSLADACLVRMAELDPKLSVMTLDSDFRVYRKNARQLVPLLMPTS
jgi:predicted nucleic acid-binding protein